MEEYRTIRGTASGEYEEKKSRFLAAAAHVESEEEAVELDERTVFTVRQALERLPQRMKEVVINVVCEGCSYAEAAERMGISVNTVKTSLHKGMKELRGMLEEKKDFLILLLYGRKIFF